MQTQKINIMLRLGNNSTLPFRATPGSSGYDLFASEEMTIGPSKVALVGTGVRAEIPQGYELQVRSRSGLAAKNSIAVLNSPGTIDSDYRGEIKVILFNHGETEFKVEVGMRIAQMVLCIVPDSELQVVEDLSHTERGSGGFGSSGV